MYSDYITCPRCGNPKAEETGWHIDNPAQFLPYEIRIPDLRVPRQRDCSICNWHRDVAAELGQHMKTVSQGIPEATKPLDTFCQLLTAQKQWIDENPQ